MTPTYDVFLNFARKPALVDYLTRDAPSIVGYWRWKDTGVDAIDEMGGNHGTYTGGYTLGQTSLLSEDTIHDYSVLLDGSTGYVTVPDATNLDVADDFTIAVLVYRAVTGVKHYIVQKGTGAFGLYIGTDDKVTLEKVGTADIVKSTTTVTASTATRIVVTKSGSTVRIYIDGIDRSDTVTNQTCANTSSALVWGRSAAPSNYFSGRLDEGVIASAAWSRQVVVRHARAAIYGQLGQPIDSIGQSGTTPRVRSIAPLRNGRNSDQSAEQVGHALIACKNDDHYLNPERNLAPNPSMELSLDDLETTALTSITAAAPDLELSTDAATGCGSYGGRLTLSATLNSGLYFLIPGDFANGETVTIAVRLKAISGTTNVGVGLASSGTPANISAGTTTITGSHVVYEKTLTLTADRNDLVGFIRNHTTGAVGVLIFDGIQVNRGSAANTYLEAPTWWMLQPGALAYVRAVNSGTTYPLHAGTATDFASTSRPNRTTITVRDAFEDLDIPVDLTLTNRTHRDARNAILDAAIRKIDGAYENRCVNGDFPSDTGGWTLTGAAARNASEKAVGTAGIEVPGDTTATYNPSGTTVPIRIPAGWVMLSVYGKLRGAADTMNVTFGPFGGSTIAASTGTDRRPALSASWQRYSYLVELAAASTTVYAAISFSSADAAKGAYVSGVMISDGRELRDWIAFGAPYGRLYDWLLERYASPESAVGWETGWHNHCTNPEAASNTTGYSTATDGFITASGGTVTRVTGISGPDGITTGLEMIANATGKGQRFRFTGTFYAGVPYYLRFYLVTGVSSAVVSLCNVGVGDSANPTDKSEDSLSGVVNGGQFDHTVGWHEQAWTPAADRTTVDVYFVCTSATGYSLQVTAVTLGEKDLDVYARAGFGSPSNLISATSISAVADAVLGRTVVEIVTRAVAGSGAFLIGYMPQVNGVKKTVSCLIRVPSGTATVALGLGDPYGTNAAVQATKTLALTTTWRRIALTFTAAANDLTSGAGMAIYLMATSASAVTVRVADVSLTVGPRTQDYLVDEAAGVDGADADIASVVIAGSASAALGAACVSMARQWFSATDGRPWGRYNSFARQSIAAQAVAATLTDSQDLGGLQRQRSATYQQVAVSYTGESEPITATATAALRRNARTVRALEIAAGGWITEYDAAAAIADATLARYQYARNRPTLTLDNDATILSLAPNHRVEMNVSAHLFSGVSVNVLSREVSITDGGKVTSGTYETEEWVAI